MTILPSYLHLFYHLAIHLRRRNISVTQHFLHRAQLHALAQHENRERVAQTMRRDVGNPILARIPLNDEPEALTRETLAVMVEEKRLLLWMTARHRRAHLVEILLQCLERVLCKRQSAFVFAAATPAWTDNHVLLGMNVGQIERDQFADAHAGGVEQVQHREIALARWHRQIHLLEKAGDLLLTQRMRRLFGNTRGLKVLERISSDKARGAQVAKESLECSQLAGNRGRTIALVLTHF